jgi:benzoate-CoA ligase family protein
VNPLSAADLPLAYNAVDILERNLPERADKVALYSDARNMTFRDVSDEANRVGNALRAADVRIGDTVALLCLDVPEFVTCYFGGLKIGAVVASLNTLLTPDDYAAMLDDCRARVLIVHEALVGKIDPVRESLRWVEQVIVVGHAAHASDTAYTEWLIDQADELDTAPTHRDDFCCLNYSSGTTGAAKGILHAHKDLPLTAHNWGYNVLGLREEDRTFSAAKLFFTFGTGGNLIFPWYVGASVVLMAGPPRDPRNVLDMVNRYRPTILYNAPTGYSMMMAVEDFQGSYDLSSLRLCVSAGEALPAPIWRQWKETTGLDTIDGIGSTENYHIFLSNRPEDIRPGSSGKPFPGYEVRIVDEEGNEVPTGEVGNLLVRGESAALFYLHEYAKSQATFMGPWLFTGDKYRRDEEGYYWHEGRSDDMLKVGGIWVSPMEVESTLLGHPAVLECAIVGARDAADLVKPKAFVVVREGYSGDEALGQELIDYCTGQIAPYKRPRWVVFADELPKTATGKIQRFRLRSLG